MREEVDVAHPAVVEVTPTTKSCRTSTWVTTGMDRSWQRLNRTHGLMGKRMHPGDHHLFTAQLAPLPDEAHGPAGKTAGKHLQRCDVNSHKVLPITGVENAERVLGRVRRDEDAVELAQPGHQMSLPASDEVGSSRQPLDADAGALTNN